MLVNVGPVNYEVIKTDRLDEDLGDDRGIILYEDLIIKIEKEMPKDLKIETIYHELSHAICEQTSFNSIIEKKLGNAMYEVFIDNMGKALYNLTHNNDLKKLDKFIGEDDDRENKA